MDEKKDTPNHLTFSLFSLFIIVAVIAAGISLYQIGQNSKDITLSQSVRSLEAHDKHSNHMISYLQGELQRTQDKLEAVRSRLGISDGPDGGVGANGQPWLQFGFELKFNKNDIAYIEYDNSNARPLYIEIGKFKYPPVGPAPNVPAIPPPPSP